MDVSSEPPRRRLAAKKRSASAGHQGGIFASSGAAGSTVASSFSEIEEPSDSVQHRMPPARHAWTIDPAIIQAGVSRAAAADSATIATGGPFPAPSSTSAFSSSIFPFQSSTPSSPPKEAFTQPVYAMPSGPAASSTPFGTAQQVPTFGVTSFPGVLSAATQRSPMKAPSSGLFPQAEASASAAPTTPVRKAAARWGSSSLPKSEQAAALQAQTSPHATTRTAPSSGHVSEAVLRLELDTARYELENLRLDREILKSEASSLRTENTTLKSEVTALRQESASLRNDLNAARNQCIVFQSDLTKVRADSPNPPGGLLISLQPIGLPSVSLPVRRDCLSEPPSRVIVSKGRF
eukprot:TRINITY_DN3570_c0_g1_i1.p2 TRINITY_DN3570_c0_g1~~TRINITY_DN3570_c0_g1_i1.p2  ORF type:complete len:350 (-),score=60.01 TRINITY_DN3570_c0_g1_i1:1166-2215(-)